MSLRRSPHLPISTFVALVTLTAACDSDTGGGAGGAGHDATSSTAAAQSSSASQASGTGTPASSSTGSAGGGGGGGRASGTGGDGAGGDGAGGDGAGGDGAGGDGAGGDGAGGDGSGGDGAGGDPAPFVPPDIVLLLVDDLDLRAFDAMADSADPALYPNLKSAIAEGMRFTNYFTTNAMCCPSRATYLTGQYPQNHGALDVSTGHGYWENSEHDDHTIATWLSQGGYATALAGKYMNEYGEGNEGEGLPSYVPPGWSRWFAVYGAASYEMYSTTISDDGTPITTADGEYQTDVLSDTGAAFLDSVPLDSPAFLYLAPTAPHHEFPPAYGIEDALRGYPASYGFSIRPAERHASLVVPGMPVLDSFDEADVSDKPAWVQALAPIVPPDESAIRTYWTEKLRAFQAVDDLIGATRAALAARNRPSYLFITSDNGYFHGEHRLSQKGCAYEEAIRLPMVVVGPGVEPGSTQDALVVNNDVAPTLAELAGASPDIVVDGRSFAALLSGDSAWDRRRFFVSHFAEEGTAVSAVDAVPPFRGLRTLTGAQDETFVEWFEAGLDQPSTAFERYDNEVDRLQLDSSHAQVPLARRATLSSALDAFASCAGETCRALEDEAE